MGGREFAGVKVRIVVVIEAISGEGISVEGAPHWGGGGEDDAALHGNAEALHPIGDGGGGDGAVVALAEEGANVSEGGDTIGTLEDGHHFGEDDEVHDLVLECC